jgi:hypothetical protein
MPPLSTRRERVSSFLAPFFTRLEFGVLPGSQPEEIYIMSNCDFTTEANVETLATEVACLKATLTLILNMERFVAQMEDEQQAEVFKNSLQQIKFAYRQ